jgi:hypothetical protein
MVFPTVAFIGSSTMAHPLSPVSSSEFSSVPNSSRAKGWGAEEGRKDAPKLLQIASHLSVFADGRLN